MLRYKITPYERAFTFQILSQDRVIKDAINSIGGSYVTSNGWKVFIRNSPEVKVVSRRLFLRGANTGYDMRIDRTWNFQDNYERDLAIESLETAIADIISFATRYDNSRYSHIGNTAKYRGYANRFEMATIYLNHLNDAVQNWASEVQIKTQQADSIRIDVNGWGNNKVDSLAPTYVAN